VNFGKQTKNVIGGQVDPTKWIFPETFFDPKGFDGPSNFYTQY